LFQRLIAERPRDINLNCGAGATTGEFPFFEAAISELSSFDPVVAKSTGKGWEREVLLGLNLARYRPKIIVIEAALPQSREESHSKWHDILENANYSFVYFDALNRFYIANESSQLKQHFALPPNVFDEIAPAHATQLEETLKASEADREARLETINKLNHALKVSEADRHTGVAQINDLTAKLKDAVSALNDMMKKYSRVRRTGPLILGLSTEKMTLN
jgi:hypothetical protein